MKTSPVLWALLVVSLFTTSHAGSRQRRQGFDSCRTPDNEAGECVDLKRCPQHLALLVNERNNPQIRTFLRDSVCSHRGSQIITCCPSKESVKFATAVGQDCQTPKSVAGTCINIRKCPELVEMLNRRQQPGVTEYLRASQCGFANRDPLVCCPNGGVSGSSGGGGGGGGGGNGVQGVGGGGLPGLDTCGLSDAANNRVVNGRPANLGSWPWMVALGYRSSSKPREWLCGGSLISDRHVLTAAHCVTNIGKRTLYLARLGDLNLDDSVDDRASPLDVEVERAIPHENYNAAQHTVDIALVKLKRSVTFSKLISPICLPAANTFQADLEGYSPFIIGWGATSYRGPSTTLLQEAQIEVTGEQSCSQAYKSIKGATIDNRVICALSPLGKDACQGDSGGPLILPKTSSSVNFFLIGIVSYGYKCAEPGYPGIYTKVSLYHDWVKRNMN